MSPLILLPSTYIDLDSASYLNSDAAEKLVAAHEKQAQQIRDQYGSDCLLLEVSESGPYSAKHFIHEAGLLNSIYHCNGNTKNLHELEDDLNLVSLSKCFTFYKKQTNFKIKGNMYGHMYVSIVRLQDVGYCFKYILPTTTTVMFNQNEVDPFYFEHGLPMNMQILCPRVSFVLDKCFAQNKTFAKLSDLKSIPEHALPLFTMFLSVIYTWEKLSESDSMLAASKGSDMVTITLSWHISQYVHFLAMLLYARGVDVSYLINPAILGLNSPVSIRCISPGVYDFVSRTSTKPDMFDFYSKVDGFFRA